MAEGRPPRVRELRVASGADGYVMSNGLVDVRAQVDGGQLRLSLGAQASEETSIPVLVRAGKNSTEGPLRVECPEQCRVEVVRTAQTATLVIHGSAGPAEVVVSCRMQENSPWVDMAEVLILDARAEQYAVDWFEAVWRVEGWREPGEVFSPCLVPEPDDVIGRHALRSPALAVQCAGRVAALVYAPEALYRTQTLPACMNLLRDSNGPELRTGLRPHRVRGHVYYTSQSAPGRAERFHHAYSLYVAIDDRPGAALDVANRRVWAQYGERHVRAAPPIQMRGEDYARQIYPAALARLWRETRIDGRRVGAISLGRAYKDDVWMCPWFSQVRSAYGLYLWGTWLGNDDWVQRAVATRDLHLAAPRRQGFFPTVFVFGETPDTCRWVGSHPQGGGPGLYHVMDMSWTVYQLLRWHRDLLPDERTVDFAREYCTALVNLQAPDGSLPAYIDEQELSPVKAIDRRAILEDLTRQPGCDPYIIHQLEHVWLEPERFVHSAEDAASLLVLAEFAALLPDGDADRGRYILAAKRLGAWIEEWVFPEARWIDFEVYYSCSPHRLDSYDGRSRQWPQGTLCMHLAAAGLSRLYQVDGDERWLRLARRAMDRLSLFQQAWDPPYLSLYGFGGYAAMNTDGEWNDARQAQCADTHLDFHQMHGTKDEEQLQRAVAACRASFTTIFLPASSSVYPTGWCREPQGDAAENHAHGGSDHLAGVSSFDWGPGSALATAAYFRLRGITSGM